MGTEIWCIGFLVALVAWQQFFFSQQIQKLIDKLMSRSFTEYQRAQEPLPPRVQAVPDIPEDLRALQEFKIQL